MAALRASCRVAAWAPRAAACPSVSPGGRWPCTPCQPRRTFASLHSDRIGDILGALPLVGSGSRRLEADQRRRWLQACAGEPLSPDEWLALADEFLEREAGPPLAAADVLLALRACLVWNVEDPSLYAAFEELLEGGAFAMVAEDSLEALHLLGSARGARGARAAGTQARCGRLYGAVIERCIAGGEDLVRAAAFLAEHQVDLPGGGPGDAALRRIALAAVEARGLRFHQFVSLELSFQQMGMLHGVLQDLLSDRRRLFLDTAPLHALLEALQALQGELEPWTLRNEEAEAELLKCFVRRLEGEGEGGADALPDPFSCLELLARSRCLPTAFLSSLCAWARRAARRGGDARRSVSVAQLVLLDDACEGRWIEGAARESLDVAIRTAVIFGLGPVQDRSPLGAE